MTTPKLNSYQREMRKMYKRELAVCNGELFSFADERVTVLVCPSAGPDGNFCQVSVAYCDEGDTFRRKVGELMVLERFENDRYLSVPFNGRDACEIARDVMHMMITY